MSYFNNPMMAEDVEPGSFHGCLRERTPVVLDPDGFSMLRPAALFFEVAFEGCSGVLADERTKPLSRIVLVLLPARKIQSDRMNAHLHLLHDLIEE